MEAGGQIGAFLIERPARAGGMGTVYRARDRATGATVAVKLLPGSPDPEDTERFLREARVLADLRHPAIVRYLAHGRAADGGVYLAMEWLDGEDLGDRLRGGGLTIDESVRLIRRVGAGLELAHARGVIHRDIKPANVFLPGGEVDQAKLLDFGVARPAGARTRLTQTGTLVGTPAYMAPEQVRGARDLDPRADVFSLGCLLFECLTGRPAFVGEHLLGVLARVLFDEAPRVAELRPEAPAALAELVARMLAKEPAGRPASVREVLATLAMLGRLDGGVAPRTPPRAALSAAERRVVSVVFAGASTETVDAAQLDVVAKRFGAQLERVTGGTLAAALTARGPATDQAADAARLALAFRTLLPQSPIALATGPRAIEDAIDRAAQLLSGKHGHRAGVWLDAVSAALLQSRFEVVETPAGLQLLGARDGEPPRTLLGRRTQCVGREPELALLEAVYAATVAEPAAHVVLVTAPPGTGKSRLGHEWLRRLAERRDPGLVLICRGDPVGAGSPFVLAAQAVRQAAGLTAGAPADAQRSRLAAHLEVVMPAASRARVTAFLGELLDLPRAEGGYDLRAALAAPVVMGDQLRLAWEDWLAAECAPASAAGHPRAARPVILVLEDLHWGDPPSIQLIDAALRHLREQPLFVLALGRRDVHDLFPRLWDERGLQELRLGELPRRAAERLIHDTLGERAGQADVARIVERAGGNALYLEELIRAADQGERGVVPESVLAMVQARLAALPAEDRRVLRAASVFGTTFWRGGVAALVGDSLTPAALDEILADLVHREVISRLRTPRFPDEQELGFRHALFREAAASMLTDADQALGHRLAAEWLLAAGERDALVLAEHLERGGAPADALPWYTRAAEEALHGDDFAGAIERASRAIVCGARAGALGHLRVLQATAHNWRGDHVEAAWCASQALELFGTDGADSAGRYDALREVLDAALPAPRDRLAMAVAMVSRPGVGAAYVQAAATTILHLFYTGDRVEAEALLATLEQAVAATPAAVGWLEKTRAAAHDFAGAHDLARAAYLRAIAAFEAAGDLRQACALGSNVGWLEATELGLHAQAVATLGKALDTARRMGLGRTIPAAEQNLGVALMRQGRLDEARALLLGTVDEFVRQADPRMEAGSLFYLTLLHTLAGDGVLAESTARRAIEQAHAVPTTRACSLAALARALLLDGRNAEALVCARESQGLLDSLGGIEEGEALIRLAFAESLAASGLRDEARAAVATAMSRLDARAARIADGAIRRSFLEDVPENARTRELARG